MPHPFHNTGITVKKARVLSSRRETRSSRKTMPLLLRVVRFRLVFVGWAFKIIIRKKLTSVKKMEWNSFRSSLKKYWGKPVKNI